MLNTVTSKTVSDDDAPELVATGDSIWDMVLASGVKPISPGDTPNDEPERRPETRSLSDPANLDLPPLPQKRDMTRPGAPPVGENRTSRPNILFLHGADGETGGREGTAADLGGSDGASFSPSAARDHTTSKEKRRTSIGPAVLMVAATLTFVAVNSFVLFYLPSFLRTPGGPTPAATVGGAASRAPATPPSRPQPVQAQLSQAQLARTQLSPTPRAGAPLAEPEAAAAQTAHTEAVRQAIAPTAAAPAPGLAGGGGAPGARRASPAVIAEATPRPAAALSSRDAAAPGDLSTLPAAPRAALSAPRLASAAPATTAASSVTPAAATPAANPQASLGPSVQIGAFASMALADEGWSAAAAAAPGGLDGRPRVIQPVQKSGHTLLRTLVTGFPTAGAAAELCSELKAKGLECFVRR